jgi:hypothetical protein
MSNTIQVKRGAKASLPTLNAGEFGFSTDTHETFIGDGAANHQILLFDTFNATSFLYATSDNTPENKTPAEVLALLSGTASASFSMNNQKITSVIDPGDNQDAATKYYVDTYYPSRTAASVGIGGVAGEGVPTLRRCSVALTTGIITVEAGDDLMLNSASDTSPDQQIIASKIWNSVWNDIADFRPLADKLLYGKCYYQTKTGAKICNSRCKKGVIGVASNTFGQALGFLGASSVPIAISGWVLAFVDKEYEIGTPLTNNNTGILSEMILEEKQTYPERLVATYMNKESDVLWGPIGNQIEVMGRHWVKVY